MVFSTNSEQHLTDTGQEVKGEELYFCPQSHIIERMEIDWVQVAGFVAVLGFLWRMSADLNNQISDLRERMAKLEGMMDVLKDAFIKTGGNT